LPGGNPANKFTPVPGQELSIYRGHSRGFHEWFCYIFEEKMDHNGGESTRLNSDLLC
jgi:hypothetical protein